jgi:hypothetical protein
MVDLKYGNEEQIIIRQDHNMYVINGESIIGGTVGGINDHIYTTPVVQPYHTGTLGLRNDITTLGTSSGMSLLQDIEHHENYRNKTLTLSIKCRASVGGLMRIALYDGTFTYSDWVPGGNVWTQMTVTKDISGSAALLGAHVRWTGGGATTAGVYLVDDAMLSIGPTQVPFAPEDMHLELNRCQRYYEKGTYLGDRAVLGSTGGANSISQWIPFKVEKPDDTPTVAITRNSTSFYGMPATNPSVGGAAAFGSPSAATLQRDGFRLYNAGPTQTTYNMVAGDWDWTAYE